MQLGFLVLRLVVETAPKHTRTGMLGRGHRIVGSGGGRTVQTKTMTWATAAGTRRQRPVLDLRHKLPCKGSPPALLTVISWYKLLES